jgi:hypothetical protein
LVPLDFPSVVADRNAAQAALVTSTPSAISRIASRDWHVAEATTRYPLPAGAPGPRVIRVDDRVEKGRTPVALYDFIDLSLLMGFQDAWNFDEDHA